ncbi:MAG: hypothetical protein Aurels2KO_17050 [Aureliella sp.]
MPKLICQYAMEAIVLAYCLACVPATMLAAETERPLPNIIVMMADDMGMGDTSAYQDVTGNSDSVQIYTPAMDRLARQGIRFVDAHTPSTRCTSTRYGLLTGRYPWRSRLKHWVLFGAQGDPLIEADRPTIATMLRDSGYRTGMVGKWHVGLRYRRSDGTPAADFTDADLTQPLWDCPLDHGFDFCRYTSRSHATSGAQPGKRNTAEQTIGPGHIDGRSVLSATSDGRRLADEGGSAYVLTQLGSRHFEGAISFLSDHRDGGSASDRPFFLYYASNSNHSPYTPADRVGTRRVAGQGRRVDGQPTGKRGDFVYENDAALAGLLDWLEHTDDPRWPSHKLDENTLVVFTSDNGAEIRAKEAIGPFRSNKGSCYEGGHRVPLIVSWVAGGIKGGSTSAELVTLADLYATLAEVVGADLPNNAVGEKGAEDSQSFRRALLGEDQLGPTRLAFVNDHKEASDPAVLAVRADRLEVVSVDPNKVVDKNGQWKAIFDASLLRRGVAKPVELYSLTQDPLEQENRIAHVDQREVASELKRKATLIRTSGGIRLSRSVSDRRVAFVFAQEQPGVQDVEIVKAARESLSGGSINASAEKCGVEMSLEAMPNKGLHLNARGVGVAGGEVRQVEAGESLVVHFSQDVVIESVAIVAGQGQCGGYYRVGDKAPLAIYCIDGDNDSKDQSAALSDLGVLRAGEKLTLCGSPHLGCEAPGRWRLGAITVRCLSVVKD